MCLNLTPAQNFKMMSTHFGILETKHVKDSNKTICSMAYSIVEGCHGLAWLGASCPNSGGMLAGNLQHPDKRRKVCQLNQTVAFLSETYCKIQCRIFWILTCQKKFLTLWSVCRKSIRHLWAVIRQSIKCVSDLTKNIEKFLIQDLVWNDQFCLVKKVQKGGIYYGLNRKKKRLSILSETQCRGS